MARLKKIPEGVVVDQWSVADPWYGDNVSQIIETEEGKFFRVSYNDCHGPDTPHTHIEEVVPEQKTHWKSK